MREELRRYLDGELPLERLPDDLRREAEAWDELLARFREEGEKEAPTGLEGRILEALPSGAPGDARTDGATSVRDLFAWLFRPHPVRIPPVAGLAAAAAVVALLLLSPAGAPSGVSPDPSPDQAVPDGVALPAGDGAGRVIVYVEFNLEAPDATEVAVLGDFNEWTAQPLVDADGDGRWTARIPVSAGVHSYIFRIDDSTWVADPGAERYVSDGFGQRNAVLAVDPVT